MHFAGAELMTGLPEYRNGGLLVDTGLLTLKKADADRGLRTYHKVTPKDQAVEVVPTFEPSDDVVVEWRACTVGFLDELLTAVNKGLGLEGMNKLTLAQMLEAGTWKVSRPLRTRRLLADLDQGRTRNRPSLKTDHCRTAHWHHI